MNPTQILKDEHRIIEQVLNVLERMATRAQERTFNPDHARDAIEFFRNFADRCHHGKEETHLFTLMEARGLPREGGPTGVMMHEHEQGRYHVRSMAELVAPAAGGDEGALRRWAEHARAYVALLREHIQKEDHCLFSMAEQMLSDGDKAELERQFDHVEHEEMGHGVHERYLKLANDLADAYGVPKAAPAVAQGHGCGCHGHHAHPSHLSDAARYDAA